MNRDALPQWLQEDEKYTPPADRDAFLDKSILAVLGVLSKIRAQAARGEGRRPAHAVCKLLLALLLIVLLAVSQHISFVLVVTVGVLVRVSLMRAEEIASVLRSSLMAVLFAFVILLPAGLMGNWRSAGMLTPKVFDSVALVAMLSAGTRWHALTGALKALFVPDIFIFVLDIAVKYILLLGEFALNMLYALKLRSVGRNAGKRASLSGIAGTMFLRSREMAGEMHAAMECRGFTGEYRRPAGVRLGPMDLAAAATAAAAVSLFIYLR
jgi:cobalt/nickel transport system permease protein